MGSQLFLPAGWASHLESHLDPSARLAELKRDRADARAEIGRIVAQLGDKHGATPREVVVALRAIDGALDDLLRDPERLLRYETGKLTPV